MRFLFVCLLACASALCAVIITPGIDSTPAPWTKLDLSAASNDFRFAVMADRTGGLRPGIFKAAVDKINLLHPDFVLCVGDLITGYSEDADELTREWDEIDGIVGGLDMPFFYLPGNHDIGNAVMARLWAERRGPAYYHFLYRDTLFLCLNTQDGPNYRTGISPEQLAYATNVLAAHPDVRWTFVLMHQPLWDLNRPEILATWAPIEQALHGRPATVLAGHYHTYEQTVRDGHDYIMLGTTGGGSWLSGPFYGQFDHIMWVSMTPGGPQLANVMTDGIASKDITTAATLAYGNELDRLTLIAVEPLTVGTTITGRMATTLVISNGTELVQDFEGAWQPHGALSVTSPPLRASLQPGEARVWQLSIAADRPLPLEATAAPRIAGTRRFSPEGYGEVSRRWTATVPIDTVYPCPRAPRRIEVDGDLADWPDLPCRVDTRNHITYPENWTGPEDGAFAFGTAHDDDYLYIAVKVTDDRLIIDRADVPWNQDSVAVNLDARAESSRAAGVERSGQFDTHLLYYLSPSAKGEMMWYLKERLPEGSQAACVPTDDGMALEIAVPISYLDTLQGGDWRSFQLNVLVNDVDPIGVARIGWRPDWYGGRYRGEGKFGRVD